MSSNKDLFGNQIENNPWQEEWQDMPEYIQDSIRPYQSIIVHFDSESDVDGFSEKIGQNIYPTTKSIWYPLKNHKEQETGLDCTKRYVDESEVSDIYSIQE